MVVFDATMLMLTIRPESGRPLDPISGKPVDHVPERIAFLVDEMDKVKVKIGIPTPALSEALVRSGDAASAVVDALNTMSVFQILPFDEMSAIEVAIMTRHALDSGGKKSGSTEIWNKIKYDRQIAAIARRNQASAIYTDDQGLRNTAKRIGMHTIGLSELLLPPKKAQVEIEFPPQSSDELDHDSFAEIDEVTDPPDENESGV